MARFARWMVVGAGFLVVVALVSCGGGGAGGTAAGEPKQEGSSSGSGTGDLGGGTSPSDSGTGDLGDGTSPSDSGTGDLGAGTPSGESGGDIAYTALVEPEPDQASLAAAAQELLGELERSVPGAVKEALRAEVQARTAGRRAPQEAERTTPADAWATLAAVAFLAMDQDTALWCALEAFGEAPDEPYVLSQVGFLLLYRGQPNRAKAFLLKAYHEAPDFPPALYNLGYVYETLGDPERAAYYYQALVAGAPENPYLAYPLARAYVAAGHPEAARPLLEHAAEAVPQVPEIRELLDSLPQAPGDPPSGSAGWGGLDPGATVGLIDALTQCDMALLNDPDMKEANRIAGAFGDMFNFDQQVQDAFSQSSEWALECLNLCDTTAATDEAYVLCEAECYAAQCGRDSNIAHDGRGGYIALYADWYRYHARATNRWTGCALDAYFQRLPQLPERVRETVMDSIWERIWGFEETRLEAWAEDVVPTTDSYDKQAASTCKQAQEAWSAASAVDLLHPTPVGPWDSVCALGVCMSWDGRNANVTIDASSVFVQVSGNYHEGFTGTVGWKLWSKGPASTNLFVRFDSKQGITGASLEGKVAGPMGTTLLDRRISLTPR